MLNQLRSNAIEAIAVRDGQTIPEVVTVVVESTLGTLRKPSDEVKRAGSLELYRITRDVVGYEEMGRVFVAMIEQAAKP